MKKNLKLIIICFITFLLSSCKIMNKYDAYKNANSYHIINENGELYNDLISDIKIDWVSGKIIIEETTKYSGVTIFESYKEKYDDEYLCHIYHKKNNLDIKYCASNITIPTNIEKTLYIYIPENRNLDELEINSISADINIHSVHITKLTIDNISGNIQLNNTNAEEIKYDGISGNFTCLLSQNTTNLKVDQISGNSILSFPQMHKGFTLCYDTISGELSSDYSLNINEDEYTYLDELYLKIEVDSISGNLILIKNQNNSEPVDRNSDNLSISKKK